MTLVSDIQEAVSQLRNTLGQIVPWGPDNNGNNVSLLAASGRLAVAPGQTIASAWGNTLFDQSIVKFDTAAQRDQQWPAPLEGSLCFQLDILSLMIRRNNVWSRMMAIDYMISGSIGGTTAGDGGFVVGFPNGYAFPVNPVVVCSSGENMGQLVSINSSYQYATKTGFAGTAYKAGAVWGGVAIRINYVAFAGYIT